MIQYPLEFLAKATALSGIERLWETHAGGVHLVSAIPPEFEGPGGGLSPEDLYALAIANCFVATFKVIAEKSRAPFETLSVSVTLTADRDGNGRPWLSHAHVRAEVSRGSSPQERIERVLQKTSESCLVIHSIKTHVHFELKVLPS